jgi:type VI secretion system protein ImpE
MESPGELLQAGRLADAIGAAEGHVKASPSDLERRWLLAELLILAGQNDRADAQLDTLISLEPRAAVTATPIRHLLRAEAARRQFFEEGRVPDLLDGADDAIRQRLEAFVHVRAGDPLAAGRCSTAAEIARPLLAGRFAATHGGERTFSDFRDLDDVTAGVFEVLTHTGKYYWIPMDRVTSIEFSPPERPLDLIWRKAHMIVRDAFEADLHMPAVYGMLTNADDVSRLGRRTDWLGGESSAVMGVGRRLFVVDGEESIDMMDLESLSFVTA